MVRFIKKLQILKNEIRSWAVATKSNHSDMATDIKAKLKTIDITLDQGGVSDDVLLSRMDLMKQLQDIKSSDVRDQLQKAKVSWWTEIGFPNRIKPDQATELEKPLSPKEIRVAVWACGADKSPGPDGFSFEFFRKFWSLIGPDMFPDSKFVSDYRPISLIGSLYTVVTKILTLRLSLVISDLISDVQTAFLPNRQILDGPFILNELLSWCKFKKQQTLVFKVDFAKAYDSIKWDYLDDVLAAFGFGSKWRSWIKGSLSNGMASILVNGSATAEFQFIRGLKQGDPLALYLFILVMESFHLSISRAIEAGFFTGIKVDRMVINLKKSQLLGIGVHCATISNAASSIGCAVLKPPFKYLVVMVGGNMSRVNAWEDSIGKIKARLSIWKLKTLSVGGQLTLLKLVLGLTPVYSMSLYKVLKTALNEMESLRRNFFNGVNGVDRKIAWVQWAKQAQVSLKATIRYLRNGTEFINQTLQNYTEEVGITHNTSTARTPRQNGIVERRNRTLVEVARTMLIFSKSLLYLWTEAVATACYTQNRSLIHTRYNKTPYELLRDHKPELKTKLQGLTSGHNSSGLVLNQVASTSAKPPTKNDWDLLFQPMFDEYFKSLSAVSTPISAAILLPPNTAGASSSSSSSIDKDAPSPSTSPNNETTSSPINSINVEPNEEVAKFDSDTFTNPFASLDTSSAESSSRTVDTSNMHTFQQPPIYTKGWTKDHPLTIIIGDPSKPISTRGQLSTDALWCYFHAFLVKEEPKNYKEAMEESSWIEAMQEEIHEFERLKV
ncbi:RNA-directed DNA polymerase, eukaryota [Tanacetum coccineum]